MDPEEDFHSMIYHFKSSFTEHFRQMLREKFHIQLSFEDTKVKNYFEFCAKNMKYITARVLI